MKIPFIALSSALCALELASCVQVSDKVLSSTHRPYRMNPEPNTETSTIKRLETGTRRPVTLGFLEFDDQGDLWREPRNPKTGWSPESRNQLTAVIEELRKQTREGPVKVVLFVHGWNNNAKPENPNLKNFEKSLHELSKVSDVPLFGVYVGWRGTVGNHPVWLDVLSREGTAERVGRSPALQASLRAIRALADNKKGHSVLAIGHSFGGKILIHASTPDIGGQFGKAAALGISDATLDPFADMIVVVNTAEHSREVLNLMNLARDHKIKYGTSERDLPLMISVSSTHDGATIRLLSVLNNVTRNGLALPHKGGASSNKIQDEALFNSIGSYTPVKSHFLETKNNPGNPNIDWKKFPDQCWEALLRENVRLGQRLPSEMNEAFFVALTPDGNTGKPVEYAACKISAAAFKSANKRYGDGVAPNDTPFWTLQVPKFVSRDHNDIWNPNFTGLLVALEAMKSPPNGRTKLGPSPKSQFRRAAKD